MMILGRRDPLQEAASSKNAHAFYSIPATHSNFFKTRKYDLEHFGLSFSQRIMCFVGCLVVGLLLFFYSLIRLPLALIYPSKFALPYALCNLAFFAMFGFLSGFKSYFSNLFSKHKRVYTLAFLASTVLTIYTGIWGGWMLLKFALVVVQMISFICFAITFLPGGAKGISSLASLMMRK